MALDTDVNVEAENVAGIEETNEEYWSGPIGTRIANALYLKFKGYDPRERLTEALNAGFAVGLTKTQIKKMTEKDANILLRKKRVEAKPCFINHNPNILSSIRKKNKENYGHH